MSSQFVTPSNDCQIQIKSEPLEEDYQRMNNLPLGSIHSPAQLPAIFKYTRVESTRNRSYEKPHSCCEVCQGEFSDQDVLLQHKLLHFNTSHVCYICDCYFMNTSTLIMHIATNHRNLNPAMTGRNDPDRSFLCSICLQRFSSNKTLTRHQETHKQQDETTFSCRICGLEFIGYRALVPHLNATRHKEMKIKIQSIFVCVDCRSVFPSRDSYAMHMMMRAQSETCSSRFLMPPTNSYQSPNSYDYPSPSENGLIQGGTASSLNPRIQANSGSTRSDSVPLNLCTGQERISPNVSISKYRLLTCCKCGELMPDEEALALHLMVHVRETSDQSYYSRYKNRPHPSEQRAVSAQYAKETPSKRPDSAPASDNMASPRDALGAIWICHWCNKNFKSCDLLAMHMMEHHMQSQAADKVNNNRRSFSDINEAQSKPDEDGKDKISLDQEDCRLSAVSVIPSPDELIPGKRLKAGETCFSERSSPVSSKRPADDAPTPQPKRCKSVGSSLNSCLYCTKQFIDEQEKKWHTVDEHGVSLIQPHCLVCNRVFLEHHALKQHLQSPQHLETVKVQKVACHVCKFFASSDAQIAAHEHLHGIRRELQFQTTSKIKYLSSELCCNVDSENQSSSRTKDDDTLTPVNDTESKKATEGESVDGELVKDSATRTPVLLSDESASRELHNNGDADGKSLGTPVQDAANTTSRRSKRKSKVTAKFTPGISSPARSISENDAWADATDVGSPGVYGVQQARPAQQLTPIDRGVVSVPVESSFSALISSSGGCSSWARLDGTKQDKARPGVTSDSYQQPSTTTGCEALEPADNNNDETNVELIDYVLSNSDKLSMCKYCKIIYTDQTIYYLHMGLHNLNNPWQCNLCGKVSRNVHDFTCHVIHY